MPKGIDLTGRKFGKLTVLKRDEEKQTARYWLCECECGKQISTITASLTNGRTKSCGCLRRKPHKHGEYKTRLYRIWGSMKGRCNDPKNDGYGGRGITVCEEWKEYIPFRDWALSNGYQDNLSIDRIDVNGNYKPDNCRWVDDYIQANNTRKNVNITWNGETHSLSEWGRIKPNGLDYDTLRSRLRDGWSVEETFSEARHSQEKDTEGDLITVNGETHNIRHWCDKTGISRSTYFRRVNRGWNKERAATEPSHTQHIMRKYRKDGKEIKM